MKSTLIWTLAAVNAILFAALVGRYISPNVAMAQRDRRPDYIILPGKTPAGDASLVYIVDTANRRLSARNLVRNNKTWTLQDMAPIPLDRIFEDNAAAPRK